MLKIKSFAKLLNAFNSFWNVLLMIINFLIMLFVKLLSNLTTSCNCSWQALWGKERIVAACIYSVIWRVSATLFTCEISLLIRLVDHAHLRHYSTVSTYKCALVLFHNHTIDCFTPPTLILLQVLLCLWHLVTLCFLLSTNFFSSLFLVLMF